MAETLRHEKALGSRELLLGRHVLRTALALVFAAVTVVLGAQGMSLRNALQWLFYLVLFVATDQIAEAIMNRLGRGHGEDTSAANKETNSSESR